jgi:glutamate racemase
MNSKSAIGMFDSGVGGLTVVREVTRLLPEEEIIYFGDTARFPYGSQAPSRIVEYSKENATFLLSQGVKALVMACNTCSAHAYELLQESLSLPIVDVIAPGAKKAVAATQSGHVAVLGTSGTISSLAYQKAIEKENPAVRVTAIACPLLAPLVEERLFHHPATELIAAEYLKSILKSDVDTLLLGCTHYPMLQPILQKIVGNSVSIVNSASACAEELVCVLQEKKLARASSGQIAAHRYFVTDDLKKFQDLAQSFLPGIQGEFSLASL